MRDDVNQNQKDWDEVSGMTRKVDCRDKLIHIERTCNEDDVGTVGAGR